MGHGIEEGAGAGLDECVQGQDLKELRLHVAGQFRGIGGKLIRLVEYDVIDEGAIGFHDVVSEREGIVLVAVVDADDAGEARANEGAGDGGPEDGIAVVEGGIGHLPFTFPPEGAAGVAVKIFLGGEGFAVARVAIFDQRDMAAEAVRTGFAAGFQAARLVFYFGPHRLFPEAFFEGIGGGGLRGGVFLGEGVGLHRQQDGVGRMGWVAQGHDGVVGGQGLQAMAGHGDGG